MLALNTKILQNKRVTQEFLNDFTYYVSYEGFQETVDALSIERNSSVSG